MYTYLSDGNAFPWCPFPMPMVVPNWPVDFVPTTLVTFFCPLRRPSLHRVLPPVELSIPSPRRISILLPWALVLRLPHQLKMSTFGSVPDVVFQISLRLRLQLQQLERMESRPSWPRSSLCPRWPLWTLTRLQELWLPHHYPILLDFRGVDRLCEGWNNREGRSLCLGRNVALSKKLFYIFNSLT